MYGRLTGLKVGEDEGGPGGQIGAERHRVRFGLRVSQGVGVVLAPYA